MEISRDQQIKAADGLEELIPAMKEIVRLLRQGQAPSKAYALVYEFRKRVGRNVAALGAGLPDSSATRYANDVIDEQTISLY